MVVVVGGGMSYNATDVIEVDPPPTENIFAWSFLGVVCFVKYTKLSWCCCLLLGCSIIGVSRFLL